MSLSLLLRLTTQCRDISNTAHGEHITAHAPLIRNYFHVGRGQRRNWEGVPTEAKLLKHSGVKHLIERAMWRMQLRNEKKRRHEFAVDHGFRKYFKTRAEQVMKPINVEWLMGHSTGVSDSYYRPTENELLTDYLRAVPLLTISEVEELRHEKEQLKGQFEERLSRIEDALSLLISQKELQVLSAASNRKPDISQ